MAKKISTKAKGTKKSGKATGSQGVTWDLTPFFPKFDGPEHRKFQQQLEGDIAKTRAKMTRLAKLDTGTNDAWANLYCETENLLSRLTHVGAFVGCLCSGDARKAEYRQAEGHLATVESEYSKLEVELKRVFKPLTDREFAAFVKHPKLAGAGEALRRMRHEAIYTMSTPEEMLAADLDVDGCGAWGRLYNTLTGKIEFDYKAPDGKVERRPMSQRRSLMEDADPEVRAAAFVGGNVAWKGIEDVMGAMLNHITGTRITLNRNRKVPHFLDAALHQSNISRKTLDAMMNTIREEVGLSRSLAKAKAESLGMKSLGWQDISAALPLASAKRFSWTECTDLIRAAFARSFPDLTKFFDKALEKRWVESEVRPGKRPGAYCTGSAWINQPRVYQTFLGSLGDIETLAHEIGHAYHSDVMKDLRVTARFYPMTLAETASTFAEAILKDGMLADPNLPADLKAEILNLEVSSGVSFLLDIPVRYEFEKALNEERAKGEISVERLKELMVEKQRELFGPTLTKNWEDPYFWASKLHFYLTGISFYNFPYSFGYLLSRGLHAQFKIEGAKFLPKYKEFLRLSGSYPAEEVARRALGIDLTKPAFWRQAIRSLAEPLAEFRKLLPSIRKAGVKPATARAKPAANRKTVAKAAKKGHK